MKQLIHLNLIIILTACSQSSEKNNMPNQALDTSNTIHENSNAIKENITQQKLLFKDISAIDNSSSVWANKQEKDVYSLILHFMEKNELAVEFSPECWLIYPYKIENNKIIVFWDNNIESKYEFDIVKMINTIDKKHIGQNFMTLELVNDTTLNAIYHLEEVRNMINKTSNHIIYFPDKFNVFEESKMYE